MLFLESRSWLDYRGGRRRPLGHLDLFGVRRDVGLFAALDGFVLVPVRASFSLMVRCSASINSLALTARRTKSLVYGKGYDSSKSSTPQQSRPSVSRHVPK